MKAKDVEGLPTVEERDLTLVAALVAVIVVAGGVFLVNAASSKYRTANYTPPASLNNVPVMTPAPPSEPAPRQ